MAKVLQRFPSQYEEHQAGCIRGLLRIFDFRHGRSTRGLLAQAGGTGNASVSTILPHLAEICDSAVDTEEDKIPVADVSDTSVKEIMQEDISNDSGCSEVDLAKTDPSYRNNRLFLKLLENPSSLLVNHVTNGDQTHNSRPAFGSSAEKPRRRTRRHRHLFHLRSKSPNKDCPSSSKIVILKPLPAAGQSRRPDPDIQGISLQTQCRKEQNERNAPAFSLDVIKKRLRQAMGKQGQRIFSDRNHFYAGEQKDSGLAVVTETCQCLQLEGSNIYIEGKRHLSEMLNNADEKSSARQMSVPLGMILSVPEYSVSPGSSPGKCSDGILVKSDKNNGNRLCEENRDHHFQIEPDAEVECPHMDGSFPLNGTQPFTEDCIVRQAVDIKEESGITPQEERNTTTSNGLSESYSELINEESLSQCLDNLSSDSYAASPALSPSSQLGDSEYAKDRTDQSNLVSVLEPFFIDNDTSPSRKSHPGEEEFQHLESEEASSANDDEAESSFEYIEAVMLASGLNWDDFLLRWISFRDILDSAWFDQVGLLSTRPQHDQKLLFDCANEALQDLCENYFRSLSGLLHGKQMFWGVLEGTTDLIHEVWERVESHPFQNPEEVDCLEQEGAGCGKWMHLDLEFELICSEMEEAIFDELVQDTLVQLC